MSTVERRHLVHAEALTGEPAPDSEPLAETRRRAGM
jgi:hypothetical protein